MKRDDLPLLAVFSAVCEHQGFRPAGRALGISASAVSHAIARLEASIGVRLLARTTRNVAPTEAGLRLLDRLGPALTEIEGAVAALDEDRDIPAGRLRITAPRSAVELLILPIMAAFSRAYPQVVLDLRVDDAFADIVGGGFDAGIRLGESIERDMVAVRLGPEQRLVVVAAPALLVGREPISHPRDLATLPRIGRRFPGGALYRWEFERGPDEITAAPEGPLILDDDGLILQAAVAGVGVAFLFADSAAPAIAKGQLVPLLEDWSPTFPGFCLYYPSRRLMRPALRVFIDAAAPALYT